MLFEKSNQRQIESISIPKHVYVIESLMEVHRSFRRGENIAKRIDLLSKHFEVCLDVGDELFGGLHDDQSLRVNSWAMWI